MRMVMSIYKTAQTFIVPFLVPAAGYFNNLSVKIHLGSELVQWNLGFGKVNVDNFQGELVPADNDWAFLQGKSSSNVARFDWTDVGWEDAAEAITDQVFFVYRNKRIYCKSDELYQLAFEASASVNAKIVIQAEYVPYPNAHYKQVYSTNSIAADSDHNKALIIPQALKGAVLRLYGHVDTATGEHGTLQVRIADRDDVDIDRADALTGFGVFDTAYGSVTGDTIPSMNVFEVMIGQPNNQGGSNQIDGIFPIRKIIHEGDAITYDLIQDSETFTAGDVDLRFAIEGKCFQKNKSHFKSHFVEGNTIIKMLTAGGTRQ